MKDETMFTPGGTGRFVICLPNLWIVYDADKHPDIVITSPEGEILWEGDELDLMEFLHDLFTKTFRALGFSTRVIHCFQRGGIKTFGELLCKTESDLNQLRHFGNKCSDEVKRLLQEFGYSLKAE